MTSKWGVKGRDRARHEEAVDRLRLLLQAFSADEELRRRALAVDPVGEVRRFEDPRDREIAAFLAAGLALGRASLIRAKLREVWERLQGRPGSSAPPRAFAGFTHRFFTGADLAAFHSDLIAARDREPLALRLARLYSAARTARPPGNSLSMRSDFVSAVSGFLDEVFPRGTNRGRRGAIPLLPSPADGSASKRTFLLFRWLLRPDDGIDLGLFRGPGAPSPSALVLPLDTHTFRILGLVGLLRRKTPSLAAATSATEILAEADPEDPTRVDFPLAHHGILARCVGRWRPDLCTACVLRPACRIGRRGRGG